MTRDSWIEAMGGIREWRQAKEAEKRERLERWIAEGGGPAWVDIGPGEKSAQLNEVWNRMTGRERGDDGGDEDMEDWILDPRRGTARPPFGQGDSHMAKQVRGPPGRAPDAQRVGRLRSVPD